MKEIEKYIDILEDRHKAYIRLIEMILKDMERLEERIEELEKEK